MFNTIVILLIAAFVIKAEIVPNVSNTAEKTDNAHTFVGEPSNGSTESRSIPVIIATQALEEISKSEIPENIDMSIVTASLINEQVRFFDEVDSLVVSSPKIRRSELESDRDVSVNDDQKNDDVNSDSRDDDKIKKEDEVASASADSTEELGVDQLHVNDDSATKEYSKEKTDVVSSIGEVSGRRMLQQDVVLDTKGRSGQSHDSENIDDMRVVPPRNFRTFDTLTHFDALGNTNPTFKNELIMPHYPVLPRQGTFYNQAYMPNPLLYRIGSDEMIKPNLRRYTSGFDPSQSRSSEEIRTLGNAYPFQAPLTAYLGETPINNLDTYWKRSEATQLPRPQLPLPFSAERRNAYQRSFNQFGVARFRRSANLNVVHNI